MKLLKQGMCGEDVKLLQSELARVGHNIKADGDFGPGTLNAVKAFQKKHNLGADGVVGNGTWEVLLFDGRPAHEHLTDEDFCLAAKLIDCEPAALKAVQKVETGGRGGFFAPSKPAILFEGHAFWSQLKQRRINPERFAAANPGILYPRWSKAHYKGGLAEYARLEQARKINVDAANASASWGMFQIMGFHYALCGYKSVSQFVAFMSQTERNQLIVFCRFIRKSAGMLPALQAKNWASFARLYNGSGYAENQYDKKLLNAYRTFAAK